MPVFKHTCPSCKANDKIVSKCRCGRKVCSGCSIDGLCADCYILSHAIEEVDIYHHDKNLEVIHAI